MDPWNTYNSLPQSSFNENIFNSNDTNSSSIVTKKSTSPASHKAALVFATLLCIGAFALGGTSAYFALKTGFLLKTWLMIGGSSTCLITSIALLIIGKKIKNNHDERENSHTSRRNSQSDLNSGLPYIPYIPPEGGEWDFQTN